MTGRQGRRRKKLLDDRKERRGYSHFKEEAMDLTMWTARFGRCFGPVVRQTTKWMNMELTLRAGCWTKFCMYLLKVICPYSYYTLFHPPSYGWVLWPIPSTLQAVPPYSNTHCTATIISSQPLPTNRFTFDIQRKVQWPPPSDPTARPCCDTTRGTAGGLMRRWVWLSATFLNIRVHGRASWVDSTR